MTKVISFRVSDDIYTRIRSLNTTFNKIFEPIASEIVKKNVNNTTYTSNIQEKKNIRYSDINDIDNIVDRLILEKKL